MKLFGKGGSLISGDVEFADADGQPGGGARVTCRGVAQRAHPVREYPCSVDQQHHNVGLQRVAPTCTSTKAPADTEV